MQSRKKKERKDVEKVNELEKKNRGKKNAYDKEKKEEKI